MPSNAQRITLVTAQPPSTLTALRGLTAPVPVGGGARWNTTSRPRRKSLTEYDGADPYSIQLSLMLDGVEGDVSVEADCNTLERMRQPAGAQLEPPLVAVIGAVPRPDLFYVITGIDWDASQVMWSQQLYRIRQQATVTLLEYVADDRVAQTPAAARARQQAVARAAQAARQSGGAPSAVRTYVVRSGDTLTRIAVRLLGSANRWKDIADLNGLRDPNHLTVGQTLRIP